MIRKKRTTRADRWLNNHCETHSIEVKSNNEVVDVQVTPLVFGQEETNLVVKTRNGEKSIKIHLNVYKMKNDGISVREFIQGYRFKGKDIVVYLAFKFMNEKNQKVISSLWGYKPTKENINQLNQIQNEAN